MARIKLTEAFPTLFEPIEFEMPDGKVFTCASIGQEVYGRVFEGDVDEDKRPEGEILLDHLSTLFAVKPAVLAGYDARVIRAIHLQLMVTVGHQLRDVRESVRKNAGVPDEPPAPSAS